MRASRLVLGLALALGACGPAPPPAPSPSAAVTPTPLPGVPVSVDAFSTVVPPQWTGGVPQTPQSTARGPVVLRLTSAAATIDVVELVATVPDDQLPTALASAADRGNDNLSLAKPAYVGGAAGLSITYDADAGTPATETEEVLVNHGGATWDITDTAPVSTWTQQRAGLIDVLTAWRWTS